MSRRLATELLELRRRERTRWLKDGGAILERVFASEAGTLPDEASVRL